MRQFLQHCLLIEQASIVSVEEIVSNFDFELLWKLMVSHVLLNQLQLEKKLEKTTSNYYYTYTLPSRYRA